MATTETEPNNTIASANALTIGVTARGSISVNGDQDWFAVYLTAGTAYQFDLKGAMTNSGTLSDPFLRLVNAYGTPLATDDDGSSIYDTSSGHITNSQIVFIPGESGTYYLGANGFDNVLGSYSLQSQVLSPSYYVQGVTDNPTVSWNADQTPAAPVTVTYSFPSLLPSGFLAGDSAGFEPFTPAQQDAARLVLQDIANLTHLTFVEVAGDAGQIRFASTQQTGSGGVTYWDSVGALLTTADIALDNSNASNADVSQGSYAYMALVHEIGHALGLKHPGNYNAGGGGADPPYLPTSQDASPYTVESYNFSTQYLDILSTVYPYARTMMAFDVAALQNLYGANLDTRTGNDTYSLDPVAMYSIWDGGGNDTLDASAWSRSGVTLNLNPGMVSYTGLVGTDTLDTKLAPCLSIDFGCQIENAVGSDFADILIGSVADNLLQGGGGDDRIDGGGGADVLVGGAGNDTLIGGAGSDTFVLALGATDTVVDFAAGASGDTLNFDALLVGLLGYTPGGDPFAEGCVRFAQQGADVVLCVYPQGYGTPGIDTVVVLQNVDVTHVVSANVQGFVPDTAPTGAVSLDGIASPGQTLSALNTLADLDGMGAISYQWQLNGHDLAGAAADTLALTGSLVGQFVSVKASYTDGHGISEAVVSASQQVSTTADLLAYNWKAHTLLDGVSIDSTTHSGLTDAGGAASLTNVTDTSLIVSASRVVPSAETAATSSAVNLQDAIAILKMIVGLDVNGAGHPLSPYQALAADFDGNGQVQLTDAIGVLKHVVGLSAPDPAWHFVDESSSAVSAITAQPLQPGQPPAVTVDTTLAASPVHVGLVGYLSGDVDGSYAGVAGAQTLGVAYFQNLNAATGVDLSQFGVYG